MTATEHSVVVEDNFIVFGRNTRNNNYCVGMYFYSVPYILL